MKKFFDFFVQDDATAVNGKTNAQNGEMAEIDKENAPVALNGSDKENQPEENGKENQVKFLKESLLFSESHYQKSYPKNY